MSRQPQGFLRRNKALERSREVGGSAVLQDSRGRYWGASEGLLEGRRVIYLWGTYGSLFTLEELKKKGISFSQFPVEE